MEPSSALLIAAICLAAAWLFTRRTSDAHVDGFAELYAVPVTDENTELIRDAIGRSRRFRAVGASVAVIIVLATASTGLGAILGGVAVGFAIGSLADELTRRRSDSMLASASLERRSIRSYVERWVLGVVATMVLIIAAQVVIGWRMNTSGWFMYAPGGDAPLPSGPPSRRVIVSIAAFALGSVVLGAVLARQLVRHRVESGSASRQAVLHALRTAAVLSLVGAILLALGVSGAVLGNAIVLSDGNETELLRWVNNLSYVASMIAVVFGFSLSAYALPRRSHAIPRRAAPLDEAAP